MTEVEWLACNDPKPMLEFLPGKVSDRKLRLFAVGCCRKIWHLLESEEDRRTVEIWEEFAEGPRNHVAFDKASFLAAEITGERGQRTTNLCLLHDPLTAVARIVAFALRAAAGDDLDLWRCHSTIQASLLRHIIGNPFRPYPSPSSWPSTIVALAEATYQGDNCSAPLHDALLEAGHPELAEHFAKEPWHPKGCWVIDMLTGKK